MKSEWISVEDRTKSIKERVMEYPSYYHEERVRVVYRVHSDDRRLQDDGIIGVRETLKEARELYRKEKNEGCNAYITKRTAKILTLRTYEYVQGSAE